ncbi:hypothetical protein AMS61_25410, partial [Bacillus sp. FJAT-21351]
MNYYVYVSYYPLMHLYQPADHKYRNPYPVDIYYTHPNYFDYRFYAGPTYYESEYQIDKRIVRKEKDGPDLETSSYHETDFETSSCHEVDLETSSYRETDLETSSYREADLEASSYHDPDLETS